MMKTLHSHTHTHTHMFFLFFISFLVLNNPANKAKIYSKNKFEQINFYIINNNKKKSIKPSSPIVELVVLVVGVVVY